MTDLDTAVRDYPELVQQYFMTTCVPVNSTKYTALHAAFWSGGVFLYIPQGIEIEDPILTQIWIDAPASATFAHTLIIADEQSSKIAIVGPGADNALLVDHAAGGIEE